MTGTVNEILSDISNKGGFVFTYSNQIELERKVTLKASTKSVRVWLDEIFGVNKVEYILNKDRIILRPKGKVNTSSSKITIHGHVTDSLSGEVLIGATVFIKDLSTGVSSNAYGFFSITIPKGPHGISVSFLGYKSISREIDLTEDLEFNIKLVQAPQELPEVSITADGDDDIEGYLSSPNMGMHKMSAEMIRKLPALAGEVDVFRALQLLPGVKNSGEVSSNLSVRGGGLDQNLILLDEAPVYNPSRM